MTAEELRYKAWLGYIADIAYNRDGYHNEQDLGELVDELRGYALQALNGEDCPIEAAYKGQSTDAMESQEAMQGTDLCGVC